MRDVEIRSGLRKRLLAAYGNDSSTLIIDELGICSGLARADMAVINGELKGFEIKSERDRLDRLPSQAHLYGKVFDTMTIVLGPRHAKKVEASSPEWWGILVAYSSRLGLAKWELIRPEGRNSRQDALSVAQLLWRDEALAVLRSSGLAKRLTDRPRKYLWEALASNFCLSDLRDIVRAQLRTRKNWRVGVIRTQCGVMSPLSSRSSGCQFQPNYVRTH